MRTNTTNTRSAHADQDFQAFQRLCRMNPRRLLGDPTHRQQFYDLANRIFLFVDSFSDPRISHNMSHVYSRKRYVKSSLAMYTEALTNKLDRNNTTHYVRRSIDSQARSNAHGEYTQASPISIKALNNELREPETLVIYEHGLYEITANESNGLYSQSQYAMIMDMPDIQTLENFGQIRVWVAPCGPQADLLGDGNETPTKEQLAAWGWKERRIGFTVERNVSVRGGYHAKRKQYSLKHIGALTINKSQGDTLPAGLAIEFKRVGEAPWEKSQIVVAFSRATSAAKTIVVGPKSFAINHMWELITTRTQWTDLMENILDQVTINAAGSEGVPNFIDFPRNYPFRVCDASLPNDNTGYVYILVSLRNRLFTYIGEADNVNTRERDHNSGHGAIGTANPADRPFKVAAYITGLSHLTRAERMSLENQWRYHRNRVQVDDPFNIINSGMRVVESCNNSYADDGRPERIHFVRLVAPSNEE